MERECLQGPEHLTRDWGMPFKAGSCRLWPMLVQLTLPFFDAFLNLATSLETAFSTRAWSSRR